MIKKMKLACCFLMWLAAPCILGSHKIVVYYASWAIYRNPPPGFPPGSKFQPHTIAADAFTHLNYAFLKPMTQQEILALTPGDFDPKNANYVPTLRRMLHDPYADIEYPGYHPTPTVPFKGNFAELAWLKQKYPYLKICIAVGGASYSDNFSSIVANAQARSRFVRLLVNFADYYHFEGIDLDWEFPGYGHAADKQNFTLFMQELSKACAAHVPKLLLTFATAAGSNNSNLRSLELTKLAPLVDWVNVFGYDFYGPFPGLDLTGHQSPLYAQKVASPLENVNNEIRAYIAGGMPAAKIVLGMPLYGRSFAHVDSTTDGLFVPYQGAGPGTYEPGIYTFYELPTYDPSTGKASGGLLNHGFIRFWDSTSLVPYIFNPVTKIFVTYDDLQSLQIKTEYVRTHGLAGVMFWEADWNVWSTIKSVKSRLLGVAR